MTRSLPTDGCGQAAGDQDGGACGHHAADGRADEGRHGGAQGPAGRLEGPTRSPPATTRRRRPTSPSCQPHRRHDGRRDQGRHQGQRRRLQAGRRQDRAEPAGLHVRGHGRRRLHQGHRHGARHAAPASPSTWRARRSPSRSRSWTPRRSARSRTPSRWPSCSAPGVEIKANLLVAHQGTGATRVAYVNTGDAARAEELRRTGPADRRQVRQGRPGLSSQLSAPRLRCRRSMLGA